MTNMRLIFICCLFLLSLPCSANRPAEADADTNTSTQHPSEYSPQSNIAAPVAQQADSIPDQPSTDVPATSLTIPKTAIISFPIRGMSMEKVLSELGQPSTRFPAVGKPPITRWVYPDRTVFFEYSHVIHVVAK
ncbi:MAG: hypothetical protein OEY36_11565 [Gammaproteobacteria bacterium]|nr:hypothetical protein [Gammaproteobacteria bacterium]